MLSRLWRKAEPQQGPWILLQHTGGGSGEDEIFAALCDFFPKSRVWREELTSQGLQQAEQLKRFSLLRSSAPAYRILQHFPSGRLLLYLRDPISSVVERYLSQAEPRPNLSSWLGTLEQPDYTTNVFTRMLAGPQFLGLSRTDGAEREASLQAAQQHLRQLPGCVLIHGQPQTNGQELCRLFPGIRPPSPAARAAEGLLESEMRQLIQAQNQLDATLYEQACKLTQPRPAQRELQLTAGIDLQPTGCYGLEVLADGRLFYWTGKEETSQIELPIRIQAGTQLSVRLETVASVDGLALDHLQVKLGGQLIPRIHSSVQEPLIWKGRLHVPDSIAHRPGGQQLGLTSPAARSVGLDQRKLGIALHRVTVQFQGHLQSASSASPVQQLGPLLTAFTRSRPKHLGAEELRQQQILESILDLFWENQHRFQRQTEQLTEQVKCLRRDWAAAQDKADGSEVLHHSLHERISHLEELLDPYFEN